MKAELFHFGLTRGQTNDIILGLLLAMFVAITRRSRGISGHFVIFMMRLTNQPLHRGVFLTLDFLRKSHINEITI